MQFEFNLYYFIGFINLHKPLCISKLPEIYSFLRLEIFAITHV